MRLISELTNEYTTTESLDETTGTRTTYIEGIFAQADLKNRNSRIYPKAILEKAVSDYVTSYVNTKRALGELNHPETPSVDPEKACILIESLVWAGSNVLGRAKVLTTPKGQILEALLRDGVKLGVSTRGLGSVHPERVNNECVSMVGDDYQIRAIDVVHSPSGIDCFVDGILENVEFYYDNGVLCEREIEQYETNVRKNDVGAIIKDFNQFMKKISL